MAQTIKLKRSGTSGATPTTSQLELGEVAINTYDGKVYIKKNVSGTESIVEVGGLSSVSLGGLSDVTISSVAADQLLQYNGSEWVMEATLSIRANNSPPNKLLIEFVSLGNTKSVVVVLEFSGVLVCILFLTVSIKDPSVFIFFSLN